jgi:subtilisin-like proprotein convertase family protein
MMPPGGSWYLVQPYSADSSFTWNTAGAMAGTWNFAVWVRQADAADAFQTAHSVAYQLTGGGAGATCSGATLTPTPAAPQPLGASVQLQASSTGCSSPTYQFWFNAPGTTTWSVGQPFTPLNFYTWQTAGLTPGTWNIVVWARQSGTTDPWQSFAGISYQLLGGGGGTACTGVTVQASGTPRSPESLVVFNASASGCSAPEYQFWLRAPGSSYIVAQAYSSSGVFVWDSGGVAPGAWTVVAWARQRGSAAAFEASSTATHTVGTNSGTACTSAVLTPSVPSPRSVGSKITFNAVTTGCSNPVFQFWLQPPGGGFTVAQAYRPENVFSWDTSGASVGTWGVVVWVKQSGSATDPQTSAALNYDLQGGTFTFHNTTPMPIPDFGGGAANSPITVSGVGGTVTKVTVSVHVTHSFTRDLVMSLVGPDSTSALLVNRRGGSGDNFGTSCASRTTFDDAASTAISSSGAPFAGSFRPEGPLTIFNGKSGAAVNGTWNLSAVDQEATDAGIIQCWSITIVTE